MHSRQKGFNMIKTTIEVRGMACGMCEAHINDAVRKVTGDAKVSSSHSKNRTEIISEQPIDEAAVRKAITDTGYDVGSITSEPYEKKKFLGLF